MLLMTSCQSYSLEEEKNLLLHEPVEKVNITVANETFTIDFTRNGTCVDTYVYNDGSSYSYIDFIKTNEWTIDNLINSYKNIRPPFKPGYMDLAAWEELQLSSIEYILAQECFSDHCNSKIREEVLQLVFDRQKGKYDHKQYVCYGCAIKTGVFLMAVILVKEYENSAAFINKKSLQQALLCLNNEDLDIEEFSNVFIEYSKKFLNK